MGDGDVHDTRMAFGANAMAISDAIDEELVDAMSDAVEKLEEVYAMLRERGLGEHTVGGFVATIPITALLRSRS